MRSLRNILITVVVGLTFLTGSIIYAHGGWGMGPRSGGKNWQQNPNRANYGPGLLLRQEMFQARIDLLAELTGQSSDAIQSKLEYKPMWAVLDEYKIDFKTFQTKMHEKTQELVKKAADDGKITPEQKELMLERIKTGPQSYGSMGRRGIGMRGCGYGRGWANSPGN